LSAALVALETSRRIPSLAVARGDRVLFESLQGERRHASDLLPRLEELLDRLGVTRAGGRLPLERIVVGTGPGSYTGLRIGLALARGLARATGARLAGIPSFEALALVALSPGETGAVVLDARSERTYHGRYRRTAEDVEVCTPPEAIDLETLRERLREDGPVVGPSELAERAGVAPDRLRPELVPDARALLELARHRPDASGPPTPLYLRPFGSTAR
jgi:tRNA threonylcarbamoyladenosine biosynthesis protein TsaB